MAKPYQDYEQALAAAEDTADHTQQTQAIVRKGNGYTIKPAQLANLPDIVETVDPVGK